MRIGVATRRVRGEGERVKKKRGSLEEYLNVRLPERRRGEGEGSDIPKGLSLRTRSTPFTVKNRTDITLPFEKITSGNRRHKNRCLSVRSGSAPTSVLVKQQEPTDSRSKHSLPARPALATINPRRTPCVHRSPMGDRRSRYAANSIHEQIGCADMARTPPRAHCAGKIAGRALRRWFMAAKRCGERTREV